ncbi:unnamed protein product [Rhizophagus irregularis]|nr:unnamed protein product [Rhizophagus irregularis]
MRFETIVDFYLITKLTCYVLESRDPQTIIRNSQERCERLAKAKPNSYMMVIMWSNDGDLFNYIKKTSNDEKFTWHKRKGRLHRIKNSGLLCNFLELRNRTYEKITMSGWQKLKS